MQGTGNGAYLSVRGRAPINIRDTDLLDEDGTTKGLLSRKTTASKQQAAIQPDQGSLAGQHDLPLLRFEAWGRTPCAKFTMKKLSHQQAGNLGELLALAKLNTLGLAAYLSPEGAPGHDLIVVVAGQPRSIEVKTRQFVNRPTEIARWPVDLGTKGDADFFLFVELDLRTITPTFYLLSNAQARTTHRMSSGLGNCYPSHVRKMVAPNDLSALVSGLSPSQLKMSDASSLTED